MTDPAPLSADELARLRAVAEVLIPGHRDAPSAADLADFEELLQRAATAIGPELPDLRDAVGRLPDTIAWAKLASFSEQHPDGFELVATLVTGAYFMAPTALEALGYPTGDRAAPPFDRAASELESGVLDPVLSRGSLVRVP